ncbi:MAG: flagellar motor switch protein FliG, partial [Planctomycetota bacterium]
MPETADAIDDAGLRRAAILLMTLPPKTAAPVLSKLPPRLIEQISIQIAQIESVSGDEQEVVMAQFLTSKASAVYASPGGLERAKELIRMAMGRDASGMLGNVQQAIESMPFGFLKKVDP